MSNIDLDDLDEITKILEEHHCFYSCRLPSSASDLFSSHYLCSPPMFARVHPGQVRSRAYGWVMKISYLYNFD